MRASRAVPDTVRAAGGTPLMNRVGHAFFKTRMRDEGGAFGGEVRATTTSPTSTTPTPEPLPALLLLELLGRTGQHAGRVARAVRSRYFISGEINSEVPDHRGRSRRSGRATPTREIGELDGISLDYHDWHFTSSP